MTLVADPGVGGGGGVARCFFSLSDGPAFSGTLSPLIFFLLISLKIPRDLPFWGP